MRRKNLGKLGEELAEKHLRKNNYKIIEKNFRSKFGEIDIIAVDPSTGASTELSRKSSRRGHTLVFVEVKTRWSNKFGPPEEAITPWKIKRIIKAGQYYKLLHPELPEALRLDAVTISLSPTGEAGETRIIKNIS